MNFLKLTLLTSSFLIVGNLFAQSPSDDLYTDSSGLEINSRAPGFTALDQDSNLFSLDETLRAGPVVLVFFRGQWCPYCNRHLSKLQDSMDLILARGATVVAVSPEKPEYLRMSESKSSASFTLVYDEGYRIARDYQVLFTPSNIDHWKYNKLLGADLKDAHGSDILRLPVPATFVINGEGVITWRHFDKNYKTRSNVKDILEHL